MSTWAAKRFWKEATAVETEGGWTVQLDGRGVRTPAKAPLEVPTRAMAQAIAAEWDAQEGKVDPTSMPVTRSANAAIDKVAHQFDEVAQMLAAYGDSDLLCYRATGPQALIDRQAERWDPLLDWAAGHLGARLTPVSGVIHAPQDASALANLAKRVAAFTPFELAAFHDLVSISGSLVLGFAATEGHMGAADLWTLSRLDEDWQEEQWGEDEEASAQAALKKQAFGHAMRFFSMCR
jgi:chaperone required for assembly of F1-ATPase